MTHRDSHDVLKPVDNEYRQRNDNEYDHYNNHDNTVTWFLGIQTTQL